MTSNESIMSQIESIEDTLQESLHKVDVIEQRLKTKLLTTENREILEKELEEVKEILRNNEAKLKVLRKENRWSFVIAASVIFIFFFILTMYMSLFKKS